MTGRKKGSGWPQLTPESSSKSEGDWPVSDTHGALAPTKEAAKGRGNDKLLGEVTIAQGGVLPNIMLITVKVRGKSHLDSVFEADPPSNKEAYLGTTVTLSCKPPKGRPIPKVTWLKNGLAIDTINNTQLVPHHYYLLSFKPTAIRLPTEHCSGNRFCGVLKLN